VGLLDEGASVHFIARDSVPILAAAGSVFSGGQFARRQLQPYFQFMLKRTS
jgi:hypothetical protein